MRFRTRAMLASSLLAVGLIAFAPPAMAQDEEHPELTEEEIDHVKEEAEAAVHQNDGAHDAEECVGILIGGGDVDECQESPSPILPAADELVWGAISFFILFGLMWKFALPAIKDGMNARTERIRADLAAAEGAKSEAETVLEGYKAELSGAKAEAGRIIEEARQAADALKKDAEVRLQNELTDIRARATADIESAKVQAIADLKGEVAQLAIGAAEVVVGHSLDQATQVQLIETYINQVATNR